MNWLSPFHYDFMLAAFGVGALIAMVCAVFSCFLILKGWSLMGDAISHAVLPGIVIAYMIGIPLAIGAFCSGLFCAVSTGYIKENSRLKEDTIMGVVFTGLFALGLVLFTKVESDQHLNHILFGSLLGIPKNQILQTLAIGTLTLLATLLIRKDLLLFCFDPDHARSIGINTNRLNYCMLSLLALTIVTSLQAVGIILVVAMLITPGCIGFLLTDRFSRMLAIAVTAAVGSTLVGVYSSFFLNASTAACIVLVQAFVFMLALVFAPKRGLLAMSRLHKRITTQDSIGS
ncbi:MAG: metal ABC transporter permease [Deltaproteobacteria bacterium]|nr:metal ABC transporter permease [Deltaproteobacteria bacterium]